MNVHWCCGSIYLKDYINIDIEGQLAQNSYLEEVRRNRTTLDRYFKYPFMEDAKLRRQMKRPCIADRLEAILDDWNFDSESIDHLVLVSAWEHFTKSEVSHIVAEINRCVKKGGKFLITFPDIKNTVLKYYDTNPEHCMILLYCNGSDRYSFHKAGYTPDMFAKYFPNWKLSEVNIINYDYPMHQIEGIKQ